MNKEIVFFWDFDGVLLDSNKVRDKGFIDVLSEFPKQQVDQLLAFHRVNGGLSRYVKFRYFFEEVRGESITEDEVNKWASLFSKQMKQLLVDDSLLIRETIDFIQKNHQLFPMHIVSGSDGKELRFLSEALKISSYFNSIDGSPTPKKQLVANVILNHGYDIKNCLLIGDSINDYEAAEENRITFYAYNNPELRSYNYIESFVDLTIDYFN